MDSRTGTLLAAEAAGLVLALLTARATQKAWHLSRARPLLFFSAGFGALAIAQAAGMLLEYLTYDNPTLGDRFDLFDVLFWTYYAALIAGLVLVFASFGRHPFRWAPAVAPILLVAGPALQFAVLVVLFFVVLHAGLNHIARARVGSLQTALGFFLLLVGQFLDLYGYQPLNPRTWYGELVGVVGFLLLWSAVTRPRGTS